MTVQVLEAKRTRLYGQLAEISLGFDPASAQRLQNNSGEIQTDQAVNNRERLINYPRTYVKHAQGF